MHIKECIFIHTYGHTLRGLTEPWLTSFISTSLKLCTMCLIGTLAINGPFIWILLFGMDFKTVWLPIGFDSTIPKRIITE